MTSQQWREIRCQVPHYLPTRQLWIHWWNSRGSAWTRLFASSLNCWYRRRCLSSSWSTGCWFKCSRPGPQVPAYLKDHSSPPWSPPSLFLSNHSRLKCHDLMRFLRPWPKTQLPQWASCTHLAYWWSCQRRRAYIGRSKRARIGRLRVHQGRNLLKACISRRSWPRTHTMSVIWWFFRPN